MTDLEIKKYLENRNYIVNSQDVIMDILNTSHQVISELYDFETHIMTIVTKENLFSFILSYSS